MQTLIKISLSYLIKEADWTESEADVVSKRPMERVESPNTLICEIADDYFRAQLYCTERFFTQKLATSTADKLR